MKTSIALIILAAGGSRRLGRPKQLVRASGETLLHRAARVGSESPCENVLCVMGESTPEMRDQLTGTRAVAVPNEQWERGIGTSIRAGVAAADALHASAVLIMLCDQPFVDAALLGALVSRYEAGGVLGAACRYGGSIGVPALFGPSLLASLRVVEDDEGAKKVLVKAAAELAIVDAPDAAIDVDTEDDVKKLR